MLHYLLERLRPDLRWLEDLVRELALREVFRPELFLAEVLARDPLWDVLRPREDLRPVVRVAFSPPIARLLSRRPRAPTCDLPSRSCCAVSPRRSLLLVRAKSRLFSSLLSYFEAPASCNA